MAIHPRAYQAIVFQTQYASFYLAGEDPNTDNYKVTGITQDEYDEHLAECSSFMGYII